MSAFTTAERALTYYRADLERIPPLTREEEASLVECLRLARAQALPPEVVTRARHRLIEGLQRLVMFLALKQAPRFARQDLEDLVQEASLALLQATDHCALLRENFSGYASYVIRRAFLIAWTQDWPVSISRDVLYDLYRHDQIRDNPVLHAERLDAPIEGVDDLTLADMLATPASSYSVADDPHPDKTALVDRLLAGLNERQRQVVRLRFGLNEADGRERSIWEIAEQLGLSFNGVLSTLKLALGTCRRLAKQPQAAVVSVTAKPRSTPGLFNAEPGDQRAARRQLERFARLREAERQIQERGERVTAHRLAALAHVDTHVCRQYVRMHRDPAYEALLHERAQERLAEVCVQLEAQGQPVTAQALVHLTHIGSREVGAFLNARAGDAEERMTKAYSELQAQGYKTIGNRRLSQAAQVSEYRATLFLREQAAKHAQE